MAEESPLSILVAPTTSRPSATRNDVYGITRVQQPQHVAQFDIGGMQTHNLSANAAQFRPIVFCPHSAAIHDDAGIGPRVISHACSPVAFDLIFRESQRNRVQQRTIVYPRFAGNMERPGERCSQSGLKVV